MRTLSLPPALGALVCAPFLAAQAAVLYVDIASTNSTPPYGSWSTAATNIQDAIKVSANGDSIIVADGLYRGGIVVSNAVAVRSVHGAGAVLIDGNHAATCAFVSDGASMTGFTFTNGYGYNGGGVDCATTSAFVSSCLIVSNFAFGSGGGASGVGGGASYAVLYNCLISNNAALNGGGTYACALSGCTLTGNRAQYAGG